MPWSTVMPRTLACLALWTAVAGCGRPSPGNPARFDAGPSLDDAAPRASAPDASPVADAIDAVIMADPDFRAYVCREDPCSLAVLRKRLAYERASLSDVPPVVGYLVSLGDQAPQQGYFAPFIQTGPTTAVLALRYFGTGLFVEANARDHGYRRLKGQYRDSATEWGEDEYAWDGKRYLAVGHRMHHEAAP